MMYVLTDGEYSDYHIIGVFSTKEKAEATKAHHNTSKIEEFEVDHETYPEGMTGYFVSMLRDGTVADCDKLVPPLETTHSIGYWGEWNTATDTRQHCVALYVRCWAKDPQHAAKIANEHRVRYIATGEWDRESERIRKSYSDRKFASK